DRTFLEVGAVLRVIRPALEQGITDAEVALLRHTLLGELTQSLERGNRRQHRNRLAETEPRQSAIVGDAAGNWNRRLLGDEHTKRQAGQGPRRRDQQMLVLDQLRKLAEEHLVELAGYGDVERQGIALLGSTIDPDLNQARTAHRRLVVPSGRVETAP